MGRRIFWGALLFGWGVLITVSNASGPEADSADYALGLVLIVVGPAMVITGVFKINQLERVARATTASAPDSSPSATSIDATTTPSPAAPSARPELGVGTSVGQRIVAQVGSGVAVSVLSAVILKLIGI
jgi:hypothetical protein